MPARASRPPKTGAPRRTSGALRAPKPKAENESCADIDTAALPGAQLIRTGLKALGGEAVTRHTRVFDALLGIDPAAPQRPVSELFRLPTFEDLFDERVARTLERLGTTQALADLRTRLDAIDERLRRLERQGTAKRARAAKR